jgi:WD40 repeat protein/DNA-binding XRE family transcriptional regulator
MLTLRTHIGLTQARLAETLGISRKAVADWEGGNSYPQTEHLQHVIALAIQSQAFPAGHVEREVRAIWQSAHQKVLLDEAWLSALLPKAESAHQPTLPRRIAWNDAPVGSTFYGREREMDLLTGWIVAEHCRVVSVLGLGGIGKSALAVSLMHRLAETFEVVIWQSLRDRSTAEEILDELIQVLAPQSPGGEPISAERRQAILFEQLRTTRVLLVLDNLDTLLEDGEGTGKMRPGFEDFGSFLRFTAETEHQSCALLTSREKPAVLVPMEGNETPVRAFHLARLDLASCEQILAEKGVTGPPSERARLIENYAGNPLALKIVAQTIVDLFMGEIALFLDQGEVIFGGVRDLLEEQFSRLSRQEQSILLWLAILGEPTTIDDLAEVLVVPIPRGQIMEALDGLFRHSLIEQGQRPGSFALHSVVTEYLTAWLIAQMTAEIVAESPGWLIEQSIELASVREYIRQAQERLIALPILVRLRNIHPQLLSIEDRLVRLLRKIASWTEDGQGYGPANLVTLLRLQQGNLNNLDLSGIALRGAYLQGIEMKDVSLSDAILRRSVFTETFGAIWAVAISGNGRYWAASIGRGEVRVWEMIDGVLHWSWHTRANAVRALAFSPDSRRLAIGSFDGLIQVWDFVGGIRHWSGWQTKNIKHLAYSPDGKVIASASSDTTVRLWDAVQGIQIDSLAHPAPVFAVAWSPDGRWLASGDSGGVVQLWEVIRPNPAVRVQTFSEHSDWVRALAFSPDSRLLASGSYDGKVILWDLDRGVIQRVFAGQTERVQRLAWSPNGQLLAVSGFDRVIWLWEIGHDHPRAVLQGHTAPINGLAFTPDSSRLLSGSDDGSLRIWDVLRGQTVQIIQGYISALYDVDWSPDSAQIITGGANAQVHLWDVVAGAPSKIWHDHDWAVYGVGWSPDGRQVASSGWDRGIKLWDLSSGATDEIQEPGAYFYGLSWSPDGEHLASGSYLHGVLIWEVKSKTRRWLGSEIPTRFFRVAWNPDGTCLACGGEDGYIYIWDVATGRLSQRLAGHHGGVNSVAWSPDGAYLASGGSGSEGGELLVWDIWRGERVQSLAVKSSVIQAVVWGISSEVLVSGSSDGKLRWWDIHSGESLRELEAHQGRVQSLRRSPEGTRLASCGEDGAVLLWNLRTMTRLQTLWQERPYERVNIRGIRGLTEAQKDDFFRLGAIEGDE